MSGVKGRDSKSSEKDVHLFQVTIAGYEHAQVGRDAGNRRHEPGLSQARTRAAIHAKKTPNDACESRSGGAWPSSTLTRTHQPNKDHELWFRVEGGPNKARIRWTVAGVLKSSLSAEVAAALQ